MDRNKCRIFILFFVSQFVANDAQTQLWENSSSRQVTMQETQHTIQMQTFTAECLR